jgi:hypothetical protein
MTECALRKTMPDSYSQQQAQDYLAQVNADIEQGRINPERFGNDFSFHQARIQGLEIDLDRERLRMDLCCRDWLQENTGVFNPYLPHRLVFRDMVQFHYRNREERKEPKIFDLKALTISDLLVEAKDLYAYRVESGRKPISLDVQMPLEDSELVILCSELEVHVGDRMVTVGA